MIYRYDNDIADLYRRLKNPWLKAKDVASQIDDDYEPVSVTLSGYRRKGIMEYRNQRPRMEYRFAPGKLELEPDYTLRYRQRKGKELAPYLSELEGAGFGGAAQYLRDKHLGGV